MVTVAYVCYASDLAYVSVNQCFIASLGGNREKFIVGILLIECRRDDETLLRCLV